MTRTRKEIQELVDFLKKTFYNSKVEIKRIFIDGRVIGNDVELLLASIDNVDFDKIDISQAILTLRYTSLISGEELSLDVQLYHFGYTENLKKDLSEVIIEGELNIYRKQYKQRIEDTSKIKQ